MGQTSVGRLHGRLDVLQTSFPPSPSWIQDGEVGNDVIQDLGRVFRSLVRWRWKMAALPLPVAILDDLICGNRKWGHPRWRPEAEGPPFSTSTSLGIEKRALYYSHTWKDRLSIKTGPWARRVHYSHMQSRWRHGMGTVKELLALVWGKSACRWCIPLAKYQWCEALVLSLLLAWTSCSLFDKTSGYGRDATAFMWRHCNVTVRSHRCCAEQIDVYRLRAWRITRGHGGSYRCIVHENYPDSKVHGANMGPIWGRQDPGGPHVGHTNLAILVGFNPDHFQNFGGGNGKQTK